MKNSVPENKGCVMHAWHIPKTNLRRFSRLSAAIVLAAMSLQNSRAETSLNMAHVAERNVVNSKSMALVKGKVIDEKGESLPGVSIVVKGSQRGTVTDANGLYQVDVSDASTVLVFSFVGYLTKEVTVGNKTTLDVTLATDTKALDELVVVGYGSTRKSDLTGAVGQVDVKSLIKAPVGSFAEALSGRVAGVQVSATDGQPGGGINIMIRGAGSLTQSTTPLYVVDGFPVEGLDPKTLNPEDIKSISILKDASSTAIYGSRAANGVILIETKRGLPGKAVLNVSSSLGFQMNPKQIPLMSPYEFLKYQVELNPNLATTQAYFTNDKTLEDYRDVAGTNWQDKVIRTGAVQIHNIALRGGNNNTQYSISGSLYDQKGVIINTGTKRYSGRVNIDQVLNDKVKTGITANYSGVSTFGQVVNSSAGNASPSTYVMMRTWVYRPVAPDPSVNLEEELVDTDAVNASDFRVNPFIDLENQHQYNLSNVLDANVYVNYSILKGLTFRTTGGVRLNRGRAERFYNSKTSQGSPFNPANVNGINGSISNSTSNSFSNENTLNYKAKIGDHNFDVLGLFALNGLTSLSNGYGGRFLPNENLGINGLDEGISFNPSSSSSRNTMVSYAGRIDYNYKSKYLATFTYRADGSSKFVDPWGYLPSGALGWNMHKEAFFGRAFPFISNSKLRASYGTTGNNRIGDFESLPRLTQTLDGYSFNNATPTGGVFISAVGNSDLRWEKVTTMDIGYELGMLDNRISLEVDLYRRTTNDLLLQASLPPTTGFGSALKNIGKLRNDGLEFTLNTVNIEGRNFGWNSSFNISFNRNKIMELTRGQQSLPTNGQYESQFNKPLYTSEIGKPAGMMIGFLWEGNYQYEHFDNPSPGVYILKNNVPTNGAVRNTIQPGDIKYTDLNNDGIINDFDLTTIGRGQPLHTGGFSNNLFYKGLSLNVFFQWAYGNNIFNANRLALEGNSNGRANVNQFASYINRWTPENPTNENYRTRGQGPIGFYSSKTVEDGSYLRLKTVSLDYSLPSAIIEKLKVSNITLSVAAQNVLTWTKYSGMDPEVSVLNQVLAPSYDFSAYPQARTLTFGVKATF